MISVCIATHNGERYIREQLESILRQLSPEDEVIISDDGSSDDTLNVIHSFKDARIRIFLFRQKKDFSRKRWPSYYYATANFQNALSQAKGEYIFLSDQDDVWCEEKVRKCMEALKHYDLVMSNFSITEENGVVEILSFYTTDPYKNANFWQVAKNTPFRGCCLAFRRQVLKQCLPFPKQLFLHDFWICWMAYLGGLKLHFIMEPLIKYRRHAGNVSSIDSPNPWWFKISYRLKLFFQLFVRIFYLRLFGKAKIEYSK